VSPQQVGPVTLAAVARRAGVAVSTASLVFSGRGPVAPETAERVRRAAAELGYAGPDPRAAQLRTGRTRVIGVSYDGTLASAFADPYQIALLGGFSRVLDSEGYALLLLPDPPGAPASPLAGYGMDALLFALCGAPERSDLDALAARGLPLLGTGAPDDPRVVQLTIDERRATADLVRHLRGLGHTRIGHVTMPLSPTPTSGRVSAAAASASSYADTRDRVLGFLDAGGSADLIAAAADLTVAGGAAAASGLLIADDPPTALVCQSDLLALGAIRAADERGLSVPGDLSVAGFDGIEAPWFPGVLTTADQRPAEKGQELGRMMLALLAGEPVASRAFGVRLRTGTTTGPAAAARTGA
jgi:DNA-binding LacI/PurR family transcriptional regulator